MDDRFQIPMKRIHVVIFAFVLAAALAGVTQVYTQDQKPAGPSPPTAGCLQFQQMDALIAELQQAQLQ